MFSATNYVLVLTAGGSYPSTFLSMQSHDIAEPILSGHPPTSEASFPANPLEARLLESSNEQQHHQAQFEAGRPRGPMHFKPLVTDGAPAIVSVESLCSLEES